jgi:hypothetical protein
MIQSDFQSVIGPKIVGLSGSEFGLGVETIDHAARELAFGSEPVEDKQSIPDPSPPRWRDSGWLGWG